VQRAIFGHSFRAALASALESKRTVELGDSQGPETGRGAQRRLTGGALPAGVDPKQKLGSSDSVSVYRRLAPHLVLRAAWLGRDLTVDIRNAG
jgi:hypothetical protein